MKEGHILYSTPKHGSTNKTRDKRKKMGNLILGMSSWEALPNP